MTSNLIFDFIVDKENKTINVKREFAASLQKVWTAWTDSKILNQWWAPKPYVAKTKSQDFKVGGKRFYAMVSPEGQERWAIQEYTSITPKTNFKMYNAFADKDENPEPSGSEWDHTFSEHNGVTTVSIVIYNESLERLERILDGFTQGMKMSLSNLENLLASLSQRS